MNRSRHGRTWDYDMKILPAASAKVKRRRCRYRIKSDFWGWLIVLFAVIYVGLHVAHWFGSL
jgi:hypothetical protein